MPDNAINALFKPSAYARQKGNHRWSWRQKAMLRKWKIVIGATALILAGAAATGNAGSAPILSSISWLHIQYGDGWYQARANQRVIIRIPPKPAPAPAKRSEPVKYEEKKIGKCLLMDRLIGSRPGPKETLEILTRDGHLIRAYLGDGCLAREFYAGAYVERSADGKLCVDRDLLHARTGAQCEIDKFRQLVPK
jgi:hypothetical protein